jgi:hypothetical protein
VGDAHRGIGLVDVLAARSRGAVGVDAYVGVVDLHVHVLVDERPNVNLGEAGVTPRRGVEGRDPHQAVDAALGGEEPVCVLAPGDEGGRLQARLLPGGGLLHLHPEAALLRPAQVHAQKHLGPVLGVGAAGAGMNRDHGIAGVVPTAEQPRLLQLGEPTLDRVELVLQLGGHLVVLRRHHRQLVEVGDVGLELAEGLKAALRARVAGRDIGRRRLVVPEAGALHLGLQALDLPA